MYDDNHSNFRILTNIYQDSVINSNIRSLNQKQHEILDTVHKWVRDHLKYLSSTVKKTSIYFLHVNIRCSWSWSVTFSQSNQYGPQQAFIVFIQ